MEAERPGPTRGIMNDGKSSTITEMIHFINIAHGCGTGTRLYIKHQFCSTLMDRNLISKHTGGKVNITYIRYNTS